MARRTPPHDDAGPPRRVRIRIRGRVQGVAFRAATRARARALSVHGWVRNRADGSVEAVFEGAAPAVEAALAFCRVGPPGARVEAVTVEREEPEGLQGFEIRFRPEGERGSP